MRAGSAPMDMHVPFAASSVRVARQRLRGWLAAQHISAERIEEARVVLSELVGNAVRHARPLSDGTLQIVWGLDGGALRLSVTDGGGAGRPHTVHASTSAVSGRGMLIVDRLADSWWVDQSGRRTTVHALLQLR